LLSDDSNQYSFSEYTKNDVGWAGRHLRPHYGEFTALPDPELVSTGWRGGEGSRGIATSDG